MAIGKRDKIKGVIWLDINDKDLIQVSFVKSEENIVTSITAEDDFWVKKIKKDFTLDQIDKMTGDYHKYQSDREILFNEFYDNYQEWKRWYDVYKSGEYQETKDITSLRHIFNIAKDKEKFFKLKLEIFELDGIKTHSDRKLKSALRKSQTVPELLGHLHSAGLDLENELALPDDETVDQDTANQEDTQGSNQTPIEVASDVPIESSSESEQK